ncbi:MULTISPECIES: hypothetical protein [Brevibacterium]|uniref:CopG family transcriptional regulator n=1 Tax=Brevibacterium salitolerans TaxID=1403566 RepID=A0ABN2WZ11_9MICO|nr:hypothetical protein [Brevibacterium sp.]
MNEPIPAEVREAIRAELEADAAEYRDHVPEGEWTKPNNGASASLTLRIPQEVLGALQVQATADGVSVSSLVRRFITDGLSELRDDDLRTALDRLEHDVAAVKARVLAS